MSASPFSWATKVLAAGALVLVAILTVGWLLPTRWVAEATVLVPAPREAIFRYLDSPEGWRDWTTWPESGLERQGPARGEGAKLSWNDLDLGSGSFTLTTVREPETVEYRVEINAGGMYTDGSITLEDEPGGVRVTWRESGDLGENNPLMGYWGLAMERAQSEELAKGLDRLATLATAPAPTDAVPLDLH
jgi:uncharacterized protein YndB with AHSA1/START domain